MKKLLSCFLALAMMASLWVPMAYAEEETGTETEVTVSAPAFPADATLTVNTSGNQVSVVFPSTATNSDGTVAPAHKIVLIATDTVQHNTVYNKVHTVEAGALTAGTAYPLTRVIAMTARRGNFTAEVYPMSTTDAATAVLGEPLTASFALTENILPNSAIRLEIEDYVPEAIKKAAETVPYASGGKLYASHNGFDGGADKKWFKSANYIARTANADLSIDVDIPYDGYYTIDSVMHHVPKPVNIGLIEIFLDNEYLIGSDKTPAKDLSINGTYPWSHMPLKLFQNQGVYLKAGKHVIDIKMTVATNTGQPQHFAMDYIQFTPETEVVSNVNDTWIEFEDFVGKAITDDNAAGKNLTNTNLYESPIAHGGAAFHTDSYATGDAGYDVLVNVPLYVESAGIYSFEYVTSKTTSSKFYLNETDYTAFYENTLTPIYTTSGGKAFANDVKDSLTSKWSYFNAAHHQAQKFTNSMYLPAGANTITVEIICRPSSNGGTAALCLDYLKLTPVNSAAVITAEGETRIELEDYTQNIRAENVKVDEAYKPVLDENGDQIFAGITYPTAKVQHNDFSIGYASGDKILDMSEYIELTGKSTHFIPVTVEKAGWYDVTWVNSDATNNNYLSVVTLCVDGKAIAQNNKNAIVDGIAYQASKYYPMSEFRGKVYLTEGAHTVTMNANQIVAYANGRYGIKYESDFLAFTPADVSEGVTLDETNNTATASVAFDGFYTGKSIIAAYAGKELVGVSKTDITEKGIYTASVSYTAKPDLIKVFIWEDTDNAQPLTVSKTFEIK